MLKYCKLVNLYLINKSTYKLIVPAIYLIIIDIKWKNKIFLNFKNNYNNVNVSFYKVIEII